MVVLLLLVELMTITV